MFTNPKHDDLHLFQLYELSMQSSDLLEIVFLYKHCHEGHITPPLCLHLLLCLHSIDQPNRPWHWLSDQNSVEQESSAFVVSWSVLEAFVTNSVSLDRTVYIWAVWSGSRVFVSGVGKLCAADDFSERHFRCILDSNGHEKINIPTAHQRHIETWKCL